MTEQLYASSFHQGNANIFMKTCNKIVLVVQTWKQSNFPSVGEWLNEVWYIHTMQHYSAIKKNAQ